mmetsp:Transcript_69987/g.200588  ORF Transcript_69987/g.200588 Transcript_69987/m.200588 type:complete len:318 (+) Transcript_69987:349-1302(+)
MVHSILRIIDVVIDDEGGAPGLRAISSTDLPNRAVLTENIVEFVGANLVREVPHVEDPVDLRREADVSPAERHSCAAKHAFRPAHAAHAAPATVKKLTEDVTEEVIEIHLGHVGAAAAAAHAFLAELVEALALLRVAQDLVGLGDVLEFLLCARLLVDVRVPLPRQLAERGFDVLFVRVSAHAEDLVVVLRAAPRSPNHRSAGLGAVAPVPPAGAGGCSCEHRGPRSEGGSGEAARGRSRRGRETVAAGSGCEPQGAALGVAVAGSAEREAAADQGDCRGPNGGNGHPRGCAGLIRGIHHAVFQRTAYPSPRRGIKI